MFKITIVIPMAKIDREKSRQLNDNYKITIYDNYNEVDKPEKMAKSILARPIKTCSPGTSYDKRTNRCRRLLK